MACGPDVAARSFVGKASTYPMFWGLTTEARIKALEIFTEAQQPAAIIAQARLEVYEWDVEKAEIQFFYEEEDRFETDESDPDDSNNEDTWAADLRTKRESQHAQKKEHIRVLREGMALQEKSLMEKAEQCAALLCIPFTLSVHQSLPRELRDMVYDLLWYQGPADELDRSITDRRFRARSGFHGQVASSLVAPYFADPRSSGEAFAYEAAERFFSALTEAEIHHDALEAYLQMDTFGSLAMRPRDLMRRLTINIEHDGFPYSLAPHDITTDTVSTLGPAWKDLDQNLHSLLSLPVKDNFSIVIYLSPGLQFSRNLFLVLEAIKPVYQALVAKGIAIKVLGYRFFAPKLKSDGIAFANGSKRISETAEQLNYYFDRTPEEWLSMVGTELEAITQPRRKKKSFMILQTMGSNLLTLLKDPASSS